MGLHSHLAIGPRRAKIQYSSVAEMSCIGPVGTAFIVKTDGQLLSAIDNFHALNSLVVVV